MDSKQIASQLVLRRAELGLTQEQLAGLMGCAVSYVQRLENDRGRRPYEQFVRWAAALGLEMHVSFKEKDTK